MSKPAARTTGEWIEAVLASTSVGTAISLACACALGAGAALLKLSWADIRLPSVAFCGLVGAATAIHFVRQFAIWEIDARAIWTAIGRLLLAID